MIQKIPKKKITLEHLAIMIAQGFQGLEQRLGDRIDVVEESVQDLKKEVSATNDRFVPWYAFESLVNRIDIIEGRGN